MAGELYKIMDWVEQSGDVQAGNRVGLKAITTTPTFNDRSRTHRSLIRHHS